MYCEKKGSDCGYLGLLAEVSESLPVERMAESGDQEALLGQIEDRVYATLGNGRSLDCAGDFCSLVGYTMVSFLELEARTTKPKG